MVRRLAVAMVVACVLVLAIVGVAFAANPHVGGATGQPNQSCEDQTTRPGDASTAPGSAFNPDGVSGGVYAGEQPQNSQNPQSVSQYDVACFQVSPQP